MVSLGRKEERSRVFTVFSVFPGICGKVARARPGVSKSRTFPSQIFRAFLPLGQRWVPHATLFFVKFFRKPKRDEEPECNLVFYHFHHDRDSMQFIVWYAVRYRNQVPPKSPLFRLCLRGQKFRYPRSGPIFGLFF